MSERWQVYKFGGSSLGTSGRLPKVLELVVAAPRPLALPVAQPHRLLPEPRAPRDQLLDACPQAGCVGPRERVEQVEV
ncbi:MAG: hypothetical protein HYV75_03335, partial [Opitutae bacterium]|nr:hypothetical protein [Opitutae bacterium]